MTLLLGIVVGLLVGGALVLIITKRGPAVDPRAPGTPGREHEVVYSTPQNTVMTVARPVETVVEQREPQVVETRWYPQEALLVQELAIDPGARWSPRRPGTLSNVVEGVAWDRLAQALPAVRDALAGGRIVRVIGPERLLRGLDAGTLQRLGQTSAVRDSEGIVGHLRFGELKSPARIAGPLAVFQIASAVTLQYYLNRIDRHLTRIEGGVSDLRDRLQNKSYAKLFTGAGVLGELEEHSIGSWIEADETRLVLAEQSLDEVFFESSKNLSDFSALLAHEFRDELEHVSKDTFRGLLAQAMSERREDASVLTMALLQRVRGLQIRLWLEAARDPDLAKSRVHVVRTVIQRLASHARHVVTTFDPILNMHRNDVRFRFMRHATPLEQMVKCQDVVRSLRAALAAAVPRPDQRSQVIELAKDPTSGELVATWSGADTVLPLVEPEADGLDAEHEPS